MLAAAVGDLQVSLRVGTTTITSDVVRQYSAAAIGSAGWGTVDEQGKAATFRYVETHQFAIPAHDLGQSIDVRVAERDPRNNGINGRLRYNLGLGQSKAFPGTSLPKAPLGKQYGEFVHLDDRS